MNWGTGALSVKRGLTYTHLVPAVVAVGLTAVLYGGSLWFGFMYDDPLDLPRSTDRSYVDIFTNAGQSRYYRPLILALWKTLHVVLGGNNGPVLHTLVLLAHAANGFLLFLLASRLSGRVTGFIALVLFISYPFSYQAVAYVNTFFHPVVTAFVLGTALLYYTWRINGSRICLVLALVSSVLALLSHEYGVTIAPMVLAMDVLLVTARRVRQPSPVTALFVAIAAGFSLIWLAIPKGGSPWEFDPESILMNSLFFSQGLVHPVAVGPGGWDNSPGVSNLGTLAILGGTALVALFACCACSSRLGVFAFAVVWFAIGVTPAMLTLPYGYVVDGPRLMYLASVGASLAWAHVLALPLGSRDTLLSRIGRLLGPAIALVILVQGAEFVLDRNALFGQGAAMVQRLCSSATDPERPGRLYVNFPSWLALKQDETLLGHSGVTMVPDYIGLGRVVYVHTGTQPEIESVYFGQIAREWVHWQGPHGVEKSAEEIQEAILSGGGVYVARNSADKLDLDLEYAGSVTEQCSDCYVEPYLADFEGWTRLLSGEVTQEEKTATVSLRWLALSKPSTDFTVFVHVYNYQKKAIAQLDGYPIGGMLPPGAWKPGNLVEDVRHIPLPDQTPPGSYQIVVGLYERANGRRAAATDLLGKRFSEDAVSVADARLGQ